MVGQLYYPEGVTASDLIPRLAKRGVVVAGGVHKDIKGALFVFSFRILTNFAADKYFRIGCVGSGLNIVIYLTLSFVDTWASP